MVRRYKYIDPRKSGLQIATSQQLLPARFHHIPGENDSEVVVLEDRNQTQVIFIVEGRVDIPEIRNLDPSKI